jgi:hypothetical protein
MTSRTAERIEFLSDVLIGAIEHSGYGFPGILEYPDVENPAETYAVIYDRYDESPDGSETWKPKQSWRVDIDTMAKGIGILRKKYAGTVSDQMKTMFEANRENDAAQLDVVDSLAILEAAIFGDVVYT